jgi:hypothetical protein
MNKLEFIEDTESIESDPSLLQRDIEEIHEWTGEFEVNIIKTNNMDIISMPNRMACIEPVIKKTLVNPPQKYHVYTFRFFDDDQRDIVSTFTFQNMPEDSVGIKLLFANQVISAITPTSTFRFFKEPKVLDISNLEYQKISVKLYTATKVNVIPTLCYNIDTTTVHKIIEQKNNYSCVEIKYENNTTNFLVKDNGMGGLIQVPCHKMRWIGNYKPKNRYLLLDDRYDRYQSVEYLIEIYEKRKHQEHILKLKCDMLKEKEHIENIKNDMLEQEEYYKNRISWMSYIKSVFY